MGIGDEPSLDAGEVALPPSSGVGVGCGWGAVLVDDLGNGPLRTCIGALAAAADLPQDMVRRSCAVVMHEPRVQLGLVMGVVDLAAPAGSANCRPEGGPPPFSASDGRADESGSPLLGVDEGACCSRWPM